MFIRMRRIQRKFGRIEIFARGARCCCGGWFRSGVPAGSYDRKIPLMEMSLRAEFADERGAIF